MPNILILSGSPVKDGSTEILLRKIADGIMQNSDRELSSEMIRLNNYMYLPCQSCGKSPEPDYCLFQDEIYPVYDLFVECDIILFGSPVYFDSVSAQAKLFIDRCNCLRPYDFNNESEHTFKKNLSKKRLGAMVLVGGERQEFEPARKVMAGFFKWTEVENCGKVIYPGFGIEIGAVRESVPIMKEAFNLGKLLADKVAKE